MYQPLLIIRRRRNLFLCVRMSVQSPQSRGGSSNYHCKNDEDIYLIRDTYALLAIFEKVHAKNSLHPASEVAIQ